MARMEPVEGLVGVAAMNNEATFPESLPRLLSQSNQQKSLEGEKIRKGSKNRHFAVLCRSSVEPPDYGTGISRPLCTLSN